MDFFEKIKEISRSAGHGPHEDLFQMAETELQAGLAVYWATASRILEGSGTTLKRPADSYYATKNNFFSLIFLYSYHRAGISQDRRIMYVAVNQCLRGMVTGCDNILDGEYKKTLDTDLPEAGTRFRSVLDIMVSDRVMFEMLLKAEEKGSFARNMIFKASAASLHALLQSGVQEAGEEGGITGVLPPEDILKSVHHYKTGLLFQAPWRIPRLLEDVSVKSVNSMTGALYDIGMGCQVMDDMADVSNDIRNHRHNYMISLLYHGSGAMARKQIKDILSRNDSSGGLDLATEFPEAKAPAPAMAIDYLNRGFKTLFDKKHQLLIIPAISFLSGRIGADLGRS
jgi:hypothetical protein